MTGHLALAVQHFEAATQGPPSEARLAAINAALTLCASNEPDALSRAVDLLQEQGLYEMVKADLPHGDRWADNGLYLLLSGWLCRQANQFSQTGTQDATQTFMRLLMLAVAKPKM